MFGHAVRLIRKEKGISQDALAQGLAINQSSVSKWERSGNLPEEHLEAVAGVLGVTVRELRAKAGALLKSKPAETPEAISTWRDTVLLDAQLDGVVKLMLATLPIFFNESINLVVVTPERFVERAGWGGFDLNIHDVWRQMVESGYVEQADTGIFKLVFK